MDFQVLSQCLIDSSTFIISGFLTSGYEKELPQQIQLKKSLGEVMEFLAGL